MSIPMTSNAPMSLDMAQSLMQEQNISNMRNRFARDGAANEAASGLSKADEAKVEKSAKEFEAMFVTQMLNHMFSSVKMEGPFSGGRAEKIWRSFMINEYGKSVTEAGGIGIAQHVKAHLLSLQEG